MAQFCMEMPGKFHKAEEAILNLQRLKEEAVLQFKRMLGLFQMKKETKSDEFCLMWDDFLIPPERVSSLDAKLMKHFFKPYFCGGTGKPINMYALLVFWGLKEFNETEAEKTMTLITKRERKGKKQKVVRK